MGIEEKKFTEAEFDSLLQQAALLYHQFFDEQRLTNFFIANQCSPAQAQQMTAIAVNNYTNFIRRRKQSWLNIGGGLICSAGGCYMSWWGWQNAAGGGMYIIYWGLVVTGIIVLVKGIMEMPRKNLLNRAAY